MHIVVEYDFYPVGQGLFSSGKLSESNLPVFRWVYDCGTSNAHRYVRDALKTMKSRSGENRHIELLVISHFDSDHISGIRDLLNDHTVDMVLLPYVPLWKRLELAFSQGVALDGETIEYFVNPADYLYDIGENNIGHVVFVLPPSQDGTLEDEVQAEPTLGGGRIDRSENEDRLPFKYPAIRLPAEFSDDPVFAYRGKTVTCMRSGTALDVSGRWEFIPYNAEPSKPIEDAFISEVKSLEKYLITPFSAPTGWDPNLPETIINHLKMIYDSRFRTPHARNAISLFLYGGPVAQFWAGMGIESHRDRGQCGILYTGDGFLNTPTKFSALRKALVHQWSQICVLQIMHHGSKKNWFKGLARRISPAVSVFSSNPDDERYQHPDAEVVCDFEPYTPVQVDCVRPAFIRGFMFV